MKKVKWTVFAGKLWGEGLKSALSYVVDCTDNKFDNIGLDLADNLVGHLVKEEESSDGSNA